MKTGIQVWKEMPHNTIFVLVVEDNEDDFRLLTALLSEPAFTGDFKFKLHHVTRISEALTFLNSETEFCDLVLLDLSLPDSVQFEGLNQIKAAWPEIPVIVLTGSIDSELARESIKRGADEHIVKQEVSRRRITHALESALFRHERAVTVPTADSSEYSSVSHDELSDKLAKCRIKRNEITERIRSESSTRPTSE